MKKQCIATRVLCACIPLLASGQIYAAPGALQDQPLTLSIEAVQPNILFLLDDSLSMDWEQLRYDGVEENFIYLDLTPNSSTELLRSCVGYNRIAYDPTITYVPWTGVDDAGQPFANQDPRAARINPWNSSTTVRTNADTYSHGSFTDDDTSPSPREGVVDLEGLTDGSASAGYVPWVDNGNGAYDAGECAGFVSVASMSAAEQVNFANWFSYARNRAFVAKGALTNIIDGSSARVGIATLSGSANGGVLVKDIDDSSGDSTAIANKANLLEFVVSRNARLTRTPLRATLSEAGRYFEVGQSPANSFFGTTATHSTSTENTFSSTSPILNVDNGGSCQQNFSILFSDGYWRNDSPPSLGNVDGPASGNTLWDGGSFADAHGITTLADVAMHYLERDLAPGLDFVAIDDIRQPGVDIDHQHMTTYTVAFGLRGTIADGGPSVGDTSYAWPYPTDNSQQTIDDMQHAAWNGRGRFLSATDTSDLITDLNEIFDDITARTTATSSAASVSSGLIGAGTQIFRTEFNTEDWSGDLFAYQFDNDGNIVTTPTWQAATELNTDVASDNAGGFSSTRNIFTYNVDLNSPSVAANRGIDLSYANLHASQQAALTAAVPAVWTAAGGTDAEYGAAFLSFLKGDITHEEGSGVAGGREVFRDRDGDYLGALINSSPQYMGPPNDKYPDQIQGSTTAVSYNAFKSLASSTARLPLVFAGGNDGMLHAFDASSGDEVFAYVPGMLTAKLPTIASTASPYPYTSYVDATPTVRDVYLTTDVDGGRNIGWRTYLVGGLRNGGKSIYALDVTSRPSGTSVTAQDIVKFEYTHSDLGYTYSRPQIAKLNTGQWVAIVGNGYNADGDGSAKLFIIDLATGQPITTNGGGIIDTNVGDNAGGSCLDTEPLAFDGDDASDCNGLSSPTLVDLNGDFKVDRIYAGDLHGNMWVFDVSNPAATWAASKLFTANRTGTGACTAASCRQPITTKPEVTLHPARRLSSTQPNILVYFGTGQHIAEGDNSTTDTQSFYAVWDRNITNLVKSDLQPRAFDGSSLADIDVIGSLAAYNGTASGSGNFGWRIDLSGAIAGETPFLRGRVVINPVLSGRLIFFVISVPRQGVSCSNGSVASYLVTLDLKTGLPPSFNPFDPDGDGDSGDFSSPVTPLDTSVVGLGTSGIDPTLIITNEDGSIDTQGITNAESVLSGRKSWSIIK